MESNLGISEHRAGYHAALAAIGKADAQGGTIAISYITGGALRIVPLVIRLFVLLLLLLLPLWQQPFAFLPDDPGAPAWYVQLRAWEAFSIVKWLVGLVIYLLYFAYSLVKNGLFTGNPGAEIHFSRYGKIVDTIRPGEMRLIVDPRVRPYAVVSTKLMVLPMPEVENNTRDNITLKFRGTLVLRVSDTLKLLQAGGFEKFLRQLRELYTSLMRDHIQRVDASTFNRFFIDPVSLYGAPQASLGAERLAQIGSGQLSVELLEQASEIDDLAVSQFELTDRPSPDRRSILPALQRLGSDYGVTIVDHVPDGNQTTNDYLHTLALPLVSAIMRLSQATDMLKGIRENEITVEIQNQVSSRQMLVLEIRKIIQGIKSITNTLRSVDNLQKLTEARRTAMENTMHALLTPHTTRIQARLDRIRASSVDLAGVELAVRTSEELLADLERTLDDVLPKVGSVVTSSLSASAIVPNADIVKALMDDTGLNDALNRLMADVTQSQDMDKLVGEFEGGAKGIDIGRIMAEITAALSEVSAHSGISTEQYLPERIEEQIKALEEKATAARPLELGGHASA
ncbi:MAG: hypothetical protein JNK87_38100 [Bryobacterales bacterium]|nr:hypothetical protein [Bryobacterales bacterium]